MMDCQWCCREQGTPSFTCPTCKAEFCSKKCLDKHVQAIVLIVLKEYEETIN